ncbi:MAG TPA: hypothetical protein VJ814_04675 [Gaiellaceae bacterium]|nr:hypothetical protein [Gaiellaceae bacterium]
MRRTAVLLAPLLVAAFAATPAFGSAIIARNAAHPTLAIDRQGRAHVAYSAAGRSVRLVASGAINARTPTRSAPQVKFRIQYGVKGSGVCRPYDGPPLAWLVKACKAPDGSYWALQAWKRIVPNYGGTSGAVELHLSHWRGALADLVIYQDWTSSGLRHIFGRLTYGGQGVYGFSNTARGNPLDDYGRNIYVDTFDSGYGKGWHRENAFLTHRVSHMPGSFCYGFFDPGHPSGKGTKYRATVPGPGVTPDVMWTAPDAGPFDASIQSQMQVLLKSWGDPACAA